MLLETVAHLTSHVPTSNTLHGLVKLMKTRYLFTLYLSTLAQHVTSTMQHVTNNDSEGCERNYKWLTKVLLISQTCMEGVTGKYMEHARTFGIWTET
jgi:hypothetical protein